MTVNKQAVELELREEDYWKLVELAAQLHTTVDEYCENILAGVVEESLAD